jgi:hypothetical protein
MTRRVALFYLAIGSALVAGSYGTVVSARAVTQSVTRSADLAILFAWMLACEVVAIAAAASLIGIKAGPRTRFLRSSLAFGFLMGCSPLALQYANFFLQSPGIHRPLWFVHRFLSFPGRVVVRLAFGEANFVFVETALAKEVRFYLLHTPLNVLCWVLVSFFVCRYFRRCCPIRTVRKPADTSLGRR